jgi:hypothetical protein
MSYNGQLAKQAKFVFIAGPANFTGAAATTEWIDMSKYSHITFLVQTGAWAGGTAAVTLRQSTSNAGTPASLAFTKYFTNDAAPTTDTLVETTASSTFNLDTASSIYVVEVNSSMLTPGYRWVNIAIATPGTNDDFYSVTAICNKSRYVSGVASPTSIA